LTIVFSILLRFTASGYHFGIFKRFVLSEHKRNFYCYLHARRIAGKNVYGISLSHSVSRIFHNYYCPYTKIWVTAYPFRAHVFTWVLLTCLPEFIYVLYCQLRFVRKKDVRFALTPINFVGGPLNLWYLYLFTYTAVQHVLNIIWCSALVVQICLSTWSKLTWVLV